jgi:hypothetical protein
MSDEGPWYIDDTTQGSGPRPEFLKTKYKSLSDQAKAYTELEKRLGDAPDNYDLGVFGETLSSEDPFIQQFITNAKAHRVPQEAFTNLAKTFIEYDKSKRIDTKAELEKLGPTGPKRLDVVNQWAKNTLSPKAFQALDGIPQTAANIELLDELRQHMTNNRINTPVTGASTQTFKPMTPQEVSREIQANRDKYVNDAGYREEIRKKLALAHGEV